MIMKFASAQARQATEQAKEKENARLTETAENIINTIVEPQLERAAMLGCCTAYINYNPCWTKVYDRVAEILQENGYTASNGKELVVKW